MSGRFISSILSILFPPAPPPVGLEELEIGAEVTVSGRVVPRDLIESPLTGERCVYYLYSIDEWSPSTSPNVGGDGFWRQIERDEAITEFYLQQGGGRAIVAPHDARVERASGPPMVEVDYHVIGRRARQLLILPGDAVEVTGVVEAADDLFDDARDYRAMARRLMLRAPDNKRIDIRLL